MLAFGVPLFSVTLTTGVQHHRVLQGQVCTCQHFTGTAEAGKKEVWKKKEKKREKKVDGEREGRRGG